MSDDIDIGVGAHETPGAQAVVDGLRARLAALREELARTAAAQDAFNGGGTARGAATAATSATTSANEAIGAFVKLGQTIDVTNRAAVAAFRAEGDAISVYLAKLNATDAELNRIGATIARVEQRAGASRFATPTLGAQVGGVPGVAAQRAPVAVPIIPAVSEQTISSFDRVAPRLRTAANGVALLSIAAETGRGSLQSMASAAGNVAIGVGALLTGPVGGLIVALGAVVTLVTVAVGLWKEAHKQLDATGKANDEAAAARIQRLAGEDAAQAESIRKQAATEIRALKEAKGSEQQKADAIVAINKARDEKLATLESDRRKQSAKEVQSALNDALSAQDKLLLNEEQQQRAALDREIAIRRAALEERRKLAKNDPDPARSQNRVGAIDSELHALTSEETDRRKQIAKDAAEARVAAERNANATLLDLLGQASAAQTVRIEQQFDELVKNLVAKGVKNAREIARSIFNVEATKNAISDIERTVTETFTKSDNEIARTKALLDAHQISSGAARDRVVAALSAERDAVAASIPKLQAMADALGSTGNRETLAKIDAAKTKLLELSLQVARAADQFAALKDTGRDAVQSALAGFFEGAAHLGTQDTTEIHALTGQLQSAQKELKELLAIPAAQRSGESNKRISDLRAEIESTSVSLDNAKQSITTWRDLFVSALQSIADALVRVSSQMLATSIIERILGLAAGAGGAPSPSGAPLSGGPIGGGGATNAAAGGFIRGPGTSTSDSIAARLSDGEYVLRAAAVQRVGVQFLDMLNSGGVRLAPRTARFAAGGLVESAGAARFGADAAGGKFEFVFHHDDGVIIRTMRSPAGRDVTVSHVRKNGRGLGISE